MPISNDDDQSSTQNTQLNTLSEQYLDLLESISEAFYGLDEDWRFIYINRKAELLWGKKRDELIGKKIWEEFPEGINTQAYNEMHRASRERQTVRFETFSVRLKCWVEVVVYPTRSGLSIYFRDIHERKQAQMELEQSQDILRLITDELPALISYIDVDRRYKFVNKRYEERFGIEQNQIIGRHVADLLAFITDETAKQSTERDLEMAFSGKVVQHEREVLSPDGRSGFIRTLMLPTMLENGAVGGVITMIEDVTSRKQGEASLARLAAIVTSSNDAIISKTLEGVVTSWNQGAERIFGYSAAEALHKNITLIIPHERLWEEDLFLRKITTGGSIENYDTVRLRKDGSQVFISVSLSPILNEQGIIIGASKIAQDITERKRAEEAVRESEARLQGIIRSAMDAIITIDEDQKIVMFNHAAETMFGCEAKDAIGSPLERFIPMQYREVHRSHIKGFGLTGVTTRRMQALEGVSGLRVNGQEFPIEASISQIDTVSTKYFTVILRDITERQKAQQTILESEERFRTAIETMPNAIVAIGSNGRIELVNPEVMEMFGYRQDELIGQPLEILLPERFRNIHNAHRTGYFDSPSPRPMGVGRELAGRHKNGSEFPVEIGLSYTRTQKGPLALAYITDITERKYAEEELRLFKHLVERMPIGVYLAKLEDPHDAGSFRFLYVSATAESAGRVSASDVIGKTLRESFPNIMKTDAPQKYLDAIETDTVQQLPELRWEDAGYPEEIFDVKAVSLGDQKIGILFENITESKQAEALVHELNEHLEQLVDARTAQLKVVNQELDEFAYVVSHDLKAPLRSITQLASWLIEDYAKSIDDEGRKMLKLMVGRSSRMHEMIEDILQYSRIGRVKENPTSIDLNALVASVIDLLVPPSSIVINIAPDLPHIYGDEVRIRQVFQNLIGNAIKFIGKPLGHISVTWSDQGTDWEFAIADDGPGIAPQYHEKIFQIFQSLAPRDEIEGTGIGLALVKKIIELHHGRVWLSSLEGQGSTFYFTLPKTHERTQR